MKSQTASFNNPKRNPKALFLDCYICLCNYYYTSRINIIMMSLLSLCHLYTTYFIKGTYISQTTVAYFIQGSHI